MPQLMPLYWFISFFMIIFILLIEVDLFEKYNKMNMDVNLNSFCFLNNNWEW